MSIKDKINALQAKTTSAGCTEAEALAASEMAARLMQNHRLTDDDLVVDSADIAAIKKTPFWQQRLMSAASIATNTAALHVSGTAAWITFYGRAPGPDIAIYLYEVCLGACKRELAEFRKSPFYRRRRSGKTRAIASNDFLTSMANRLAGRVVEQFKPLYSDTDRQLAIQASAKAAPDACSMKSKSKDIRYSEAAHAGWSAGAKPALNVGLGSKKQQALIA